MIVKYFDMLAFKFQVQDIINHHKVQDNKLTIKVGRRGTDQTTYLISGHLSEGLLELLSDGLVLLLLSHQLIFESVHLFLELLD